jgi:hypothetical protein
MNGALAANLFDVAAELGDAMANSAPVTLQFRFTGASRIDTGAEPRQLRTSTGEVRKPVAILSELDLQAALARARMLRKDVQDNGCPV